MLLPSVRAVSSTVPAGSKGSDIDGSLKGSPPAGSVRKFLTVSNNNVLSHIDRAMSVICFRGAFYRLWSANVSVFDVFGY
jgi:hypothetical protein